MFGKYENRKTYYILIDEVQEVRDFVSALSTLNLKPNVGNVTIRTKDEDGKPVRNSLEVDSIANKGSKRYYIQSAWRMPDTDKVEQETRSLRAIGDSFKKIIVTAD